MPRSQPPLQPQQSPVGQGSRTHDIISLLWRYAHTNRQSHLGLFPAHLVHRRTSSRKQELNVSRPAQPWCHAENGRGRPTYERTPQCRRHVTSLSPACAPLLAVSTRSHQHVTSARTSQPANSNQLIDLDHEHAWPPSGTSGPSTTAQQCQYSEQ